MSGAPEWQNTSLRIAIDAIVAERCAPLVEAAERAIGNLDYFVMMNRPVEDGEEMLADLRAALAAYRAAQGAGRGDA